MLPVSAYTCQAATASCHQSMLPVWIVSDPGDETTVWTILTTLAIIRNDFSDITQY